MAFVIKDSDSGEYYRQRPGKNGYYDTDLNHVRLYGSERAAQQIADSGHYTTTFQEDRRLRKLKVVEVNVTEVEQ